MAFFTGKGDGGTTKLFDSPQGKRVSKSSPIFETLGMLDELNTLTGWCRVAASRELKASGRSVEDILLDVQDHLFTLQAEVAGAQKSISQESVDVMNSLINGIEKSLPEVKTFLVPGGTEFSARLDIARAVSRRVERRIVALHESGERVISDSSRAYANRLSSLFYALVRLENHSAGISERPPQYL
ncbi:MAG: cob(I)yrinic acid a,c-diamide adenosyltransferase [Candidatus Kaiserbacteria bacterium]|nr:cob(I)yrinic acid a,c-diamide adenosyltransferase [Candidatus Kaiserbacteria bacterium]